MVRRGLYILTCGLLLAGIIHIIIILLIPSVSNKDAAQLITRSGKVNATTIIGDTGNIRISERDPFFKMALCRYDLTNVALKISADRIYGFWSASVFNNNGNVIYSLNDRTAIANKLDLIVVNSIQRADLRQFKPEEIENSILVEASENKGFFLLRALVDNNSKIETVNQFLQQIACEDFATR